MQDPSFPGELKTSAKPLLQTQSSPSGLTDAYAMLLQVVGCFTHADNAPVIAL
jgi:hypothetical protein